MARRKRRRDSDEDSMELNMTPMIDVCFNLLIFFMLTCNFKKFEGALDAHLPKDRGQSTSSEPQPELEELRVIIELLSDGTIQAKRSNMSIIGVYNSPVTLGTALDDFFAAAKDKCIVRLSGSKRVGQPYPVIIEPQEPVPFKYCLSAMNAAIKNGFNEVSFSVQPERAAELRRILGG